MVTTDKKLLTVLSRFFVSSAKILGIAAPAKQKVNQLLPTNNNMKYITITHSAHYEKTKFRDNNGIPFLVQRDFVANV